MYKIDASIYLKKEAVHFQLDSARLCFEFTVVLEVEVESQQPAVAKVFDYYESGIVELSQCVSLLNLEFLQEIDSATV